MARRQDQGSPLRRTREAPALQIHNDHYVKGQRCPGCKETKATRDAQDFQAFHYGEQPAASCTVCKDGDRLTGRRVTPPPGQQVVCDDEGTCSFLPDGMRRFFGLARGTRKRRGAKKRGTKKRRGTKKHGSKKRHGKKRRGSKKRGRSRKHHRGGNGCGSRKRKRKSMRMYGGSNSHLSPMAINSELTRQQLSHVPPAGTGALAV